MKVNRQFLLLLIPFFLPLTGCGTIESLLTEEVYEAPPSELTEFSPEFEPKASWKEDAGDGAGETNSDLGVWWQNDQLIAVDYEGEVTALNVDTGRHKWDTDLDTAIIAPAGGGMGMVLIGTQKGELIALAENSGEEIWRARVSSEVLARPVAADNVAVVRTADGRVTGLSADTGEIKWSYQRSVPLLSLRGAGAPVIANSMVIAGYDNGKLVALSLTDGKVIWEKSIAVPRGRTELDRLVDIDADPLVLNDTVYAVTYQGNLAGVDLNSGQIVWSREMSSQLGLAADYGEAVYVTDDEGYVWAVQDGTGDALWRQTRLVRRGVTGPAVAGDYIVVGDFEGYLHWIARNDGRFVARQQITDAAIRSQPVVKNGVIYITAVDGTVAAVRVP